MTQRTADEVGLAEGHQQSTDELSYSLEGGGSLEHTRMGLQFSFWSTASFVPPVKFCRSAEEEEEEEKEASLGFW